MEQAIKIIESVLKGNGVSSDKIDYLMTHLADRAELLERMFTMSKE